MLLFHTIHRAGSAPPPIALVDRYVNVPVPSSPPTRSFTDRKRTFRDVDRATRCRMDWNGERCLHGGASHHLVYALVPFLTFHFLLHLSGQSVRPRPPPFCHHRWSFLLSWLTVFSVRCARSTSIPRPLVGQVIVGGGWGPQQLGVCRRRCLRSSSTAP